jgi:hypothetical protein
MTQIQIIIPKQIGKAIESYFVQERKEKEEMRNQYKQMQDTMSTMAEQLKMISDKVNGNTSTPAQPESAETTMKTTPTMAQVVASTTKIAATTTTTTTIKAPQTLEELRDDISDISETTMTTIKESSKSDKEAKFKMEAVKQARKMNKAKPKSKGPAKDAIIDYDVLYVSRLERKSYKEMKTLIQGLGADLTKVKRMTWVALSTIELWIDKNYKNDLMKIFKGVGWEVRPSIEIEKCRTDDAPEDVKHNQFQKAARHYGTLLYDCQKFIKDKYYENGLIKFIESKGQRFVDTVQIHMADMERKALEQQKAKQQQSDVDVDMQDNQQQQAQQERSDAADTQAEQNQQ